MRDVRLFGHRTPKYLVLLCNFETGLANERFESLTKNLEMLPFIPNPHVGVFPAPFPPGFSCCVFKEHLFFPKLSDFW